MTAMQPNHSFQWTAGKLRLPVPSALRAPAAPELKRWASMSRSLFMCLLSGLVAGCASPPATSDADWRERMYQDARKSGVMAQFCVLETKLPGHLAVFDILREGERPRSIGSSVTRNIGTSSSGQFIFQSYLGKLEEFTAAIVSPMGPEQHIFLARKSLYSVDSWSEWVPPDIVSSNRDIQFKLLYGKDVAKEGTGPVKVLARFKVGSYVQWREATDGLRNQDLKSNLEPCPLTPNPPLQGTLRRQAGYAPLS